MSKIVLITGCSTGIGRDLAHRLTQSGYTVVATARDVDSLKDLDAALKLPLDVTQPDSVDAAVSQTLKQFGRIDVLVNNAGYAIRGAIEEVSPEQLEQIFAVNVFGVHRMIRTVAPILRNQGAGRIINISSIAGKLSTPENGAYSATKFALEALSDALRLELCPFGIQVVVIEPGPVRTSFDQTSRIMGKDILSNHASPYQPLHQKSEEFGASMKRQQVEPEIVSKVILQAIESPKPKARYLVAFSFSGKIAILFRDLVWDMALQNMFKFNPIKTN